MYYKVVSDGQIVDVSIGVNYVRWSKHNNRMICCDAEDAEGFVSSDGTRVFLLEGSGSREGMTYARLAEITQEQYEIILQELIDNGVIDDPDAPQPDEPDDGDDEGDDGGQEPVAKSKLMQRVEALEEQNAMLVECILEMSEIVYGE